MKFANFKVKAVKELKYKNCKGTPNKYLVLFERNVL